MSDASRGIDPHDKRGYVPPYVPEKPRDPLNDPIAHPHAYVPNPREGDPRDKRDTRSQGFDAFDDAFTFPQYALAGQTVTSTFGKVYQFDGQNWKEGASALASTYIFRIGLDENPPGTVDLLPATATGEIGGINEPTADGSFMRNAAGGIYSWAPVTPGGLTFDTGLTLTGTSVNLDPALPPGGEIGGINEPPADTGLQYTRSYTGGAGIWTELAAGGLTAGIGIDFVPPGGTNIDLLPATTAVIGGVSVVARSNIQGLDLVASGALTAPLATDLLAGSILEPLPDGLQYVRTRSTAGVSSWVVATTASLIWGIGIDEDTVTPGTIHLQPANFTPGEIGGITADVRSLTQGLLLDDVTGLLTAPVATDLLAGSIVEPTPSDTVQYARQRTVAGVSSWVPVAGVFIGDAPPATPIVGGFWYDSDTGRLYLYVDDGNSQQFVQVGGV
jgi:hypothetical protein